MAYLSLVCFITAHCSVPTARFSPAHCQKEASICSVAAIPIPKTSSLISCLLCVSLSLSHSLPLPFRPCALSLLFNRPSIHPIPFTALRYDTLLCVLCGLRCRAVLCCCSFCFSPLLLVRPSFHLAPRTSHLAPRTSHLAPSPSPPLLDRSSSSSSQLLDHRLAIDEPRFNCTVTSYRRVAASHIVSTTPHVSSHLHSTIYSRHLDIGRSYLLRHLPEEQRQQQY